MLTATALHEFIETLIHHMCGFRKHLFPKLSRLQEHVGECGARKSYSLNRSPTGTNARVPHGNNSGNLMHEIFLFLVLKGC